MTQITALLRKARTFQKQSKETKKTYSIKDGYLQNNAPIFTPPDRLSFRVKLEKRLFNVNAEINSISTYIKHAKTEKEKLQNSPNRKDHFTALEYSNSIINLNSDLRELEEKKSNLNIELSFLTT